MWAFDYGIKWNGLAVDWQLHALAGAPRSRVLG
jgi:hypothetical protein